jgi:Cytochrome b562
MNQFLAVAIMIAGLGLNAFAGPDLGGVMKTMATNLGQIQQQVSDASQNASTEALCDSLNAAIEQAKTITPNKVLGMPADQQAAQTQAYVGMLGQLEGLVSQLKADLVANDNTSAAAVITQINALKVQGHTAFR